MEKGIIVSIQGYGKGTTQEIADEVTNAGAVALRLDKKVNTELPIIGLLKAKNKQHECEAYITHTLDAVRSVSEWADYVAIDYRRISPYLKEISDYCRVNQLQVVADVSDIYDVYNIFEKKLYYTYLATTLSVFGHNTPNFWFLKEVLKNEKKVIAEGNFKTFDHIKRAAKAGAPNICVGYAITGFFKRTQEFKNCFDRSAK